MPLEPKLALCGFRCHHRRPNVMGHLVIFYLLIVGDEHWLRPVKAGLCWLHDVENATRNGCLKRVC